MEAGKGVVFVRWRLCKGLGKRERLGWGKARGVVEMVFVAAWVFGGSLVAVVERYGCWWLLGRVCCGYLQIHSLETIFSLENLAMFTKAEV